MNPRATPVTRLPDFDRLTYTAAALLCIAAALLAEPAFGQTNEGEDPQSLVDYYLPQSMLYQADGHAVEIAGSEEQWNGAYTVPEPEGFKMVATEFLTIYPRAFLTAPNETIFATLAAPDFWDALEQIGITLIHPVAYEQAGQVTGREISPSVDGGFDRISLAPEPEMGSLEEVQALSNIAAEHGAVVAGDIIPLHTGRGYDFRLAQMNYGEWPGLFDMIEVPRELWNLLPPVEDQWGFEIITNQQALPLIEVGVMPGRFDVLLGNEESTNWSGWAATGEVMGVDGVTHRWIYAHLFKPEQPALNWIDPTYAARRMQAGDIIRHVRDYGNVINRLDAVPFLGLAPIPDSDDIDVFTNPVAISGTEDLAFMHRKLGGWTWVELNSPTEEYNRYMENGPDIGYDFFTRAQTVHPLLTGDARILRVAHRSVIEEGVEHGRLIHALQNHDEIAYQLINLRAQDQVQYGNETLSGVELADRILMQMQQQAAGAAAPYNALYRPSQNGVATTYAAFIAPALGVNPYTATADEIETIKQAHVMLAAVNAMQPGIFALSQWDLVGALPLDRSQVQERIAEGDFRWLNRGSVDLMGVSSLTESAYGLAEAQTLYPPLPEQLSDPESFVRRVAQIIDARKRYQIADATALAAPEVNARSAFVLIMQLSDEIGGVAVTAANYSRENVTVEVDLSEFDLDSEAMQSTPRDIISNEDLGTLSGTQLTIPLEGLSAATIVLGASSR